VDLPSRSDLFANARRYAKQQQLIRINPAIIDVPGSNINLLFGGASLMGEMITAAWAKCIRGLFVSTARGAQLDKVVADRFGITRLPATLATVDLVLARPTDGAGGGTVSAGNQLTTADGSVFTLQADVVFGATDLTQPGEGVAAVTGSAQNVAAGALNTNPGTGGSGSWIEQPFDATIQVTNPAGAAGGNEVESDDFFRARALTFYITARRGILAAIQFGAVSAGVGATVATAFEIVNPGSAMPAGAVELIVGDQNGNSSRAMIQGVIDNLLTFRAAGIPVFVSGGVIQFEQVIYNLEFQAGIDTVAASSAVRATLVAITQFYRPGQPLLVSDCAAAARAVPGVIVNAGSVVAPVGDVEATSNSQILRVRPQDVSFVS